MRFWQQLLLETYIRGTWPARRWANARREREGRAPVVVLFYHRVADVAENPWTLSFARFERQMRWLQANSDLVSLAEAQRRLRDGNRRLAVSVTFDDGYGENCDRALPLLIAERIPCTYFVTLRNVVEGVPFPHDIERGQPLRPNTLDELRSLAETGVEIGAHTRTHADLGMLDSPERLRDEVVTAGRELERAVGRRVRYFAFPFGQRANLNDEAARLAREAGYEAVCSAYGAYNFPGDDPFHLRRIHADPEWSRFHNWLTIDPRKGRASPNLPGQPASCFA